AIDTHGVDQTAPVSKPAEAEKAGDSKKGQPAASDRFAASSAPGTSAPNDDAVREQAMAIRSRRASASDGQAAGDTLSYAAWTKEVQQRISSHGVWGPSTKDLTQLSPADLPPKLRQIYDKMKRDNLDGFTPNVY